MLGYAIHLIKAAWEVVMYVFRTFVLGVPVSYFPEFSLVFLFHVFFMIYRFLTLATPFPTLKQEEEIGRIKISGLMINGIFMWMQNPIPFLKSKLPISN